MTTVVSIFNLSIRLESDDYILHKHIKDFLEKYYTIRQKGFGPKGQDTVKVFAGKLTNFGTWQFHTTQFAHLYQHLKEINYPFKVDEKYDFRDYQSVSANFKVRDHWVLRDDQPAAVDFLTTNPVKSKLVPIQTGGGKAQPLDSRIKIPGGWQKMGNMKVGTVITAKDGTPTRVIGVYPQGKKPIYKITFADGRSCEASDEHLWKVYYINTTVSKRWRIVNTLELIRLNSMPNPRVYIDLCDSEITEDIDLPLHPYLLGALIGDGGFTAGIPKFSKQDTEIIEKMTPMLPEGLCFKEQYFGNYNIVRKDKTKGRSNPLTDILKQLGLWGKLSYEKTIPEFYLTASHNQRLNLLQGLLDTDGTLSKIGSGINYSTSSYYLALQVQYLVRSLGGIASLSIKSPTYTYKDQKLKGRVNYRIFIRYKKPSELFTLTRKQVLTNDDNQYSHKLKLRIETIEYIGEKECQCIAIEHPEHLYVTDNFVVTHNTVIALSAIAKLNKRLAIVVLSRFSEKFVADIASVHEAKTKDVMVIQGAKALASIINMAKDNEIVHDYFVFSAETLQSYITNYEEDPEATIDQYGCSPMELFPLLGIGIMLNDETHMSFHLIYKIIIYTNVEYQIGLTATLISDEHIVRRMHKVVYPENCVYSGSKLVKYMDMYPIAYSIHPEIMRRLKTSNYGSTNYSHTAFEQSILRSKDILDRYFKIVRTVIEDYYDQHYMDGDKLVIFVSLVQTASVFVKKLKDIYPEKNVVRYCQEDAYDDMLEGDIIVSTPLSLGTGIDIKGLRAIVNTVSVSSSPVNIQMAGRLRQLKDRDVKYCYIYCENIPKQKQYSIKRVELFKDRAASINYRRSRINIQ